MIRKLGCLSAVVMLAVLAAIGWLGYQTYLHVTDYLAIESRTSEVQTAWDADAAALKAAANGRGGVRPAALPEAPFQQLGASMADSYRGSGRTLVVGISVGVCNEPERVVEVRESTKTVVLLVHPRTSWLPDVAGAWDQLRGGTSCPAIAVPATVQAALVTPLGNRVVVDAVTGTSVRRTS